MPFADFLTARATIARPRRPNADPYNAPLVTVGTTTVATGIACRLTEKSQTAFDSQASQFVRRTGYLLLLPAGTDILANDVVTIADLAAPAAAGPFRVASVLVRRGRADRHISATLEVID